MCDQLLPVKHRLSSLQDSTQQTMLTTWLVELFLNDLGALRDEGDRDGHAKMAKEFHSFLEIKSLRVGHMILQPCHVILMYMYIYTYMYMCVYFLLQECLDANSKTMYDLLSSHGAVEDVVFFATLMEGEGTQHLCLDIMLCLFVWKMWSCLALFLDSSVSAHAVCPVILWIWRRESPGDFGDD